MKSNQEKKKAFQLTKHIIFLFFLLFGPLLFSKALIFSLLIHFKRFKVLYKHRLQFYKSSLNSNNNRTTYKEFFLVIRNGLCNI